MSLEDSHMSQEDNHNIQQEDSHNIPQEDNRDQARAGLRVALEGCVSNTQTTSSKTT